MSKKKSNGFKQKIRRITTARRIEAKLKDESLTLEQIQNLKIQHQNIIKNLQGPDLV